MEVLTLEQVKDSLLSMLIALDEYCKRNSLRYYLCGGALIGAIRHKGFIPWDDDIDVLMPRPDYERFIKISKDDCVSPNYITLSYKNSNSNLIFAKLANKRLRVENKYQIEEEYVSIDIFPLDGISNNKVLAKMNYRRIDLLRSIYGLKLWKYGVATKKSIRIAKKIAYPITKIIDHKKLCLKMDKIAQTSSFEESNLVGDIIWGYGEREIMPKEKFLEQIDVEFEGHKFITTKYYHEYLSKVYGDYMKLPPMEKRKNHELKVYRI